MHQYFLTELALQKMEKVQTLPKLNIRILVNSLSPQQMTHNLQNVSDGMAQTSLFSKQNFWFSA